MKSSRYSSFVIGLPGQKGEPGMDGMNGFAGLVGPKGEPGRDGDVGEPGKYKISEVEKKLLLYLDSISCLEL